MKTLAHPIGWESLQQSVSNLLQFREFYFRRLLETYAGNPCWNDMFIVKRPNTQNWQLEIRFPKDFVFSMLNYGTFKGRHHFTKSLGTPDRAEAEIKAAPYIHHYRIAMYQWKHRHTLNAMQNIDNRPISAFQIFEYRDGLQTINGFQAVVKKEKITIFGIDGAELRIEVNPRKLATKAQFVDDPTVAKAFLHFDSDAIMPANYMPAPINPDDEVVENYIVEKRLSKLIAADARSTWAFYKTKIGKPLKNATRKDGKELVRLLFATGLAHATVKKKVSWLSAACTHAMEDTQILKANPFAKVMPPPVKGGAVERHPFNEAEMAICFANLHRLSADDALLWKLLAKTGMRLGEAMSIHRETHEVGSNIRYVSVGTKTDSSERNVPIPLDIGMPDQIKGPLFEGGAPAASKRLNRHIKASLSNWTPALVVHSLRHRVVDVMRIALQTDPHLARRLVGHASQDVHDRYGKKGPPMALLKPIIDMISIDGHQKAKADFA